MGKNYSLYIYKHGSEIIVENNNGDVISRGISAADDSRIIRDAIDSLQNGTILFDGTFKITSAVDNLKSDLHLQGLKGKTRFDCTGIESLCLANSDSGYSRSTINLVEDAYAGNDTIIVENASNLQNGDFIKIVDDFSIISDDLLIGPLAENFQNGEILKISNIHENTIFLDNHIRENYTISRHANIRKIILTENITIEGIEFIGPGMDTHQQLMELVLQKNFAFKNNIVESFGEVAVGLIDSRDSILSENQFRDVYLDGVGYSISIENACENISVENNRFSGKGRHFIVCTASHGTHSDGGFGRNIKISNNTFENSTQEAINTHEPFMGPLNISNNKFSFCDKGIEITNGHSNIFINQFNNCGIGIHILAGQGRIYDIHSNEFYDCKYDQLIEIGDETIKDNICNGKFYLSSEELRCL